MGKTKKPFLRHGLIQRDLPHWIIRPFSSRGRYVVLQLQSAYRLGYRAHEHEVRKDGHLYFTHPIAVAQIILYEWRVHDLRSIIGALLHDTREIRHPRITITQNSLRDLFGHDVEVDNHALTRKGYDKQQKEEKARYVRRLERQGWRAVLVKLADRTDNLRTLQFQPREKWKRIYYESVEFYVPLVATLGVLLPHHLKPVTARVEKSLERALEHANRLIQKLP